MARIAAIFAESRKPLYLGVSYSRATTKMAAPLVAVFDEWESVLMTRLLSPL